MTKQEFIERYNVSAGVAEQFFGDLGMACVKANKANKNLMEDLAYEEKSIRAEFAEIKDGKISKDQNGNIILDETKTLQFETKLRAWHKEEVDVKPVISPIKESSLEKVSPAIYDILNGYSIEVSESQYIEIQEKKVQREEEEKKAKAKQKSA